MPTGLGESTERDGGDGGLVLTNEKGTRIRWLDTATFILGVLAAEFYSGLSRFVAALMNASLVDPLRGIQGWVGAFVGELFRVPNTSIRLSFAGTVRFLEANPVVSVGLGVAFVLVMAYAFSRVIPRG